MIVFQAFDTDEQYDFVALLDGQTTRAPVLAQLSGSLSPYTMFCSTQRYMRVTFTSDYNSQPGTGFIATFRTRMYHKELNRFV
jgi:CUB domain